MIFRKKVRAPDLDDVLRDAMRDQHRSRADVCRDFKAVFYRDEQSRRVLAEILRWARLTRPVRSNDPYDTYFREGERNIGLKLLAVLNSEPDPKE